MKESIIINKKRISLNLLEQMETDQSKITKNAKKKK
jgi:hypothetical protein